MKVVNFFLTLILSILFLFPAPKAEAGIIGEIVDFIGDMGKDPKEVAEKHADEILDALWKSAVLMEESKLCIAEALELDPREIAASQASIRAMTSDRHDLNAIRQSTYNSISEDELRVKTAQLLSIEDQVRYDQINRLLQKSKDARTAAHAYNIGAIGRITQATIHINRIDGSDEDQLKQVAQHLSARINEAKKLLQIQKQQSEMFHEVLEDLEERWNIKEPSKAEQQKIEREILPE